MVTFQYFDGCPNADITLENLKKVVLLKGIEELEVIKIESEKDCEDFNFQGSPTILVDGIDLYTMKPPGRPNYSCRVYFIDGRQTGIIPEYFIIKRLNSLNIKILDD